jgi:hypothetical protein
MFVAATAMQCAIGGMKTVVTIHWLATDQLFAVMMVDNDAIGFSD